MSIPGTVPIRPSPQKASSGCVLLAPAPVTAAARGARRPLPPPPGRVLKRRPLYSAYVPSPQPTNVLRRNLRERNRVKQVNHGFAALRNHIPGEAKNKKLSKVDTLRRAMEYIESLQRQLDEHSAGTPQQQPSPALPRPQSCTALHFSGYLAAGERSPAAPGPPAGYLTPPGYQSGPEEQHGGYLTPQSSPLPCQPSPLTLTPVSLASVDSGGSVSGPPRSYTDTPSPTAAAYEHPNDYTYSEELGRAEPDADFSPEDEELLDAIAWWQTSQ